MKPQNLEWYGEYIWTHDDIETAVYFIGDDMTHLGRIYIFENGSDRYELFYAALANVRKAN